MTQDPNAITKLILDAARKAREETSDEPEPDLVKPARWPIECTVGPGLEGAIASGFMSLRRSPIRCPSSRSCSTCGRH